MPEWHLVLATAAALYVYEDVLALRFAIAFRERRPLRPERAQWAAEIARARGASALVIVDPTTEQDHRPPAGEPGSVAAPLACGAARRHAPP